MLEEGYLDKREYEIAVDKPLEVAARSSSDQIAPYFAEDVRKDIERTFGSSALLEQVVQAPEGIAEALIDYSGTDSLEKLAFHRSEHLTQLHGVLPSVVHRPTPPISLTTRRKGRFV